MRTTPSGLQRIVDQSRDKRVAGVEREFSLHGPSGPVPFAPVLAACDSERTGLALDPGDRHARRTQWGGTITADGQEAEAATPPVDIAPGCTDRALELCAAGRKHIESIVPSDVRLVGYSTHFSFEVPDSLCRSIALRIARSYAAPVMLLMDRRSSPGLLIRPRHGRIEICGEYLCGDQLRAAMALSLGVVELARHRRLHRRKRPLGPLPTVDPAVERFGWYVDRGAFGTDLYADGRTAELRRGRRSTAAGAVLARTWEAARARTEHLLSHEELALVDAVIDGRLPLPLEEALDEDGVVPVATQRSYDVRRRSDLQVTVTGATWHRAVLEICSGDRRRWVTIPGRVLDAVLDAIDDGSLDQELLGLLASSGRADHAGRRRSMTPPSSGRPKR